MIKDTICIDHFNYIIEIEDIATNINLGSIKVQRDHDNQCKLVDLVNLYAPEDMVEEILDHAHI